MSTEEKDEKNPQNQEPGNQTDPILQSCRTSAISKITTALNEGSLTNADLEPTNQN